MLKIGVLGAGHLGKIHIKCILQSEVYELVGFYDPDLEKAKDVEETLGVKFFPNMEQLIEAVDVVDIVTPTLSHYDCALLAIKKLKHIFIEKPITNTIEEADNLLKLVKEANIKVQVGHVERFNPAFLALKESMSTLNPMFIEAHRLSLFNPRGTDVSIVLDLMIHDIDIVLHMVKSEIKQISASGVAIVSSTPDIANARIEFFNGCVANLTASRISIKSMRKMRFFQKDAYCSVDFLEKKSEVLRLESETPEGKNFFPIDLGPEKGQKFIDFSYPKVYPTNAIQMELEALAESIHKNTTPPVSILDGVYALKTAHLILEKINQNQPINAL